MNCIQLNICCKLCTAPSSPRWNDQDCEYPNIEGASDYDTCLEWRKEIEEHTISLRKCCECNFGECEFGRKKLSKKQLSGELKGESLCGITQLEHEVSEKRHGLENTSWDEIAEWYYTDSEEDDDEYEEDDEDEDDEEEDDYEYEEDDEDEDEEEDQLALEKKMQLYRHFEEEDSYILKFRQSYLDYLKEVPISASA